MKSHLVTISTKTLIKLVAVVLLLWILYLIRDIILLFFVAVILASLIEPWANWCEKRRIPRPFAVLSIYAVLISVAVAVVVLLVPPIVRESHGLVKNVSTYWEATAEQFGNLQLFSTDFDILQRVQDMLVPSGDTVGKTLGSIAATISSVFGGIFSLVLVLVLAFYLVVAEESAWRWVRSFVSDEKQPFITRLITKIRKKLGHWLWAQIILSFIVGLLTYLGLLVLGVEYALVLGVIAGVMELVPYVGPVLAALPAIFLAFTQTGGWVLPIAVTALFIVIQQIENHLLVPRVMQKAVGLSPIISILAILIGAKLAGVVGILLAIPVATVAHVFIEEIRGSER